MLLRRLSGEPLPSHAYWIQTHRRNDEVNTKLRKPHKESPGKNAGISRGIFFLALARATKKPIFFFETPLVVWAM